MYSNKTIVFYYLIRKHPEIILHQQNSIFTTSDKIFESVEKSFGSCLNQFADVKELIPEFYCRNPDFLVNCHKMQTSGEQSVQNVEIPEWAKSAEDFSYIMRTALESDFVSETLHSWVDLIFGVDQQSTEKFNNFNPECQDIEWGAIKNDQKHSACITLLKEYGVLPSKAFDQPSPVKTMRIVVVSPLNTEQKSKIQKVMNSIISLTSIQNKEFRAQEKQYKQLLAQETQENNKEIQEKKNQLLRLNQEYQIIQLEIEESFKVRDGKRFETEVKEGKTEFNKNSELALKDRKGSQKKLVSKDSEKNLFARKNEVSAGKPR